MPKSDQDVAARRSAERFAARQADISVSYAANSPEIGRRREREREPPNPAETRPEPRRQSPEARQLQEDLPSSAVRAREVGRGLGLGGTISWWIGLLHGVLSY